MIFVAGVDTSEVPMTELILSAETAFEGPDVSLTSLERIAKDATSARVVDLS